MVTTRSAKATPRTPAAAASKVAKTVTAPARAANEAARAATPVLKAVMTDVEAKAGAMITDTKRAEKVYTDVMAETSDRIQALMMASAHLAEGYHDLQREAALVMQNAAGTLLSAPIELARCTSFTEFAEKQQTLLHKGVGDWLEASEIALRATRRVIDRALRPIEQQISAA